MFKRYADKKQGEDDRDFDTTSLRYSVQRHWIARDYGAHFFRWGFASNWIKGGERVLDIGCGPDQALVRLLCHHPGKQPKILVTTDYADVPKKHNVAWHEHVAPLDITTLKGYETLRAISRYDLITCFEVIEHMQKVHGRKLLKNAFRLLEPKGTFLLSCPVFDGKRMAKNHIHEYYADELAVEIEKAGFLIQRRFGTFQTALQARKMKPEHYAVWKELSAYYGNDVMACFMAPLYPNLARNNLWVLKKGE